MTLADGLALVRALSLIPIWYALGTDQRAAAFAFFIVAALTDAIDGWLARRLGSSTVHGAVLDPIADKVLVLGTAATLYITGLESGPAIDPLLFGLLVVLELTSAVIRLDEYRRGVSRPADVIGKAKTAAQMVALAVLIVVRPPEAFALVGVALLWTAVLIGLIALAQQWPHRRRRAL